MGRTQNHFALYGKNEETKIFKTFSTAVKGNYCSLEIS